MKNHTRMVTLVLAMSIAAGLFSCGENEPEQTKTAPQLRTPLKPPRQT